MPETKTLSSANAETKALRNEAQWDMLLPSSPDDEQLTPILANQMRHNSNQSGNHGGAMLPPEGQDEYALDPTDFNPYDFSNDPLDVAPFLNFNDRTNTGMTVEEPLSATSITSRSLQSASRKSTGLADMSSQLLSPVLTASGSPAAGETTYSPTMMHKVLGGGHAEYFSSQDTSGYSNDTTQTPKEFKTPTHASPLSQQQSPMVGTSQSRNKRRGSDSTLPMVDEQSFHNEESDPTNNSRQGVDPASRIQMGGAKTTSLNQQANKRAVEFKNNEVSKWLSTHELTAADHDRLSKASPGPISRRRSRSTGNPIMFSPQTFQREPISERHSDGGGENGVDDDSSYHGDVPLQFAKTPVRPTIDTIQPDPRPEEASPWVDPVRFPSAEGSVGQPETSADAMMRFIARARDIETASRAATWGTQRRMSDPDGSAWTQTHQEAHRIFGHGGLLSRLSLSKDSEDEVKAELKHLVEHAKEKAARWWPKRESFHRPSPLVRSPSNHSAASPTPSIKSKRESTHDLADSIAESIKARLHRHSSSVKKSSVSELDLQTTISGTASGSNAGEHYPTAHSPTYTITALAHAARERLSRHSSKDETSHLASLWKAQSNGPPVAYPKLTQSPANKSDAIFQAPVSHNTIIGTAPVAEPTPIQTGFLSNRQLPNPTLEGFVIDTRQRLPHLQPFLVDRLALEQRRRYKRLVEQKATHAKHVAAGTCTSGQFCVEGEAHIEYYDAKAQKESSGPQMGIDMAGDEDGDEILEDGYLTENSFPNGMPSAPAKKLPARFECPLCFEVKRFAKPSDWSKHVHEDLSPFTCTFADCSEPKSFKRKADWVRHENERHRELEWWMCTVNRCGHKCNRRDNFVQHLSREHQIEEPKTKPSKADNKPAVRGPAKSKGKGMTDAMLLTLEENTVASLVVHCRHETLKQASDEPCRLCGKSFNSFKRLTADSAKHMEDLSLPVLELVKMKEVTAETIISPVETKTPSFKVPSPYTPSSSMISPYDPSMMMEMNASMPDLSGAFAPLPATTAAFQAPHFSNVVWPHVNTSTAPTTMMYPSQVNSWTMGTPQFGNGTIPLQGVMGVTSSGEQNGGGMYTSAGFVQPQTPLLNHGNNFGQHQTPVSMIDTQYQPRNEQMSLAGDMNISPRFGGHYSDVSSNHTSQHSPLMGYGSQTHAMYNQQTHHQQQQQQQQPQMGDDAMLYDGAIDPSFPQGIPSQHMHHHLQQQQQPGSSTHFFPPNY